MCAGAFIHFFWGVYKTKKLFCTAKYLINFYVLTCVIFQTPYYWPSQHHTPDNIEYSIYLYKRAQKNKKIHGLEAGLQV